MRKIITLALLGMVLCAQAGVRPVRQAAVIAANKAEEATLQLTQTVPKLGTTEPAYYVYEKLTDGFVLVSGDDRTAEVLFYSDEGSYAEAMQNPTFAWFMAYLQERLSAVNDSSVVRRSVQTVTPIEPMLDIEGIKWDQDAPFNNLCPIDPLDETRSYTGCVATAAAQILRYWKHPQQTNGGVETYGWEYATKRNSWSSWFGRNNREVVSVSLDYDTIAPYNWALMKPSYTGSYTSAQAYEVARLMYHVAVACHMDFGGDEEGGSGALLDTMGLGLEKHFGYHYTAYWTKMGQYYNDYYRQSGYPSSEDEGPAVTEFEAAFNADLEAGRPILMAGYDISGGLDNASGHSFVVDGRDSDGNFHFNFGWSGIGNGYSPLSVIKSTMGATYGSTGDYEFGHYIDALIGLEPDEIDTVHVTQVKITPSTMTLRIDERSSVSATIYPADATVKSYSWSSADETIATISSAGVVRGVAPGETDITLTSRDGGKTAVCHVVVLNELLPYSACDDYNYLFQYTLKPVIGTNTFGDYDWTIAMEKGKFTWDSSGGLGFKMGSNSVAALRASFVTENTNTCKVSSVTVNSAKESSGDGQLAVYIGDEQVGEKVSLTSTATDYTFVNTQGLRGPIEIRFTNTQKAMYIKSIHVAFDDVSGIGEPALPLSAVKVIEDGHLLIIRNGRVYDVQGQILK